MAEDKQPRLAWEWLIPLALLAVGALYGAYRLLGANVAALLAPPVRQDAVLAAQTVEDVAPRDYTRYGTPRPEPAPVPALPPMAAEVSRQQTGLPAGEWQKFLAQQSQFNMSLLEGLQALTFRPAPVQSTATPEASRTTGESETKTDAGTKAEKTKIDPRRKQWEYLVKAEETTQPAAQASLLEEMGGKKKDEAQDLIKPARWAVPLFPTKTLYKQQSIPGVTMDEMNSSIPGQYRIRVSVPVFNRFDRNVELIPKDSVIIIKQEVLPEFGQRRLKLAVDEIQLPTPEVIKFQAAVGDSQGAVGVTGAVNNRIPSLVLATLISTAVNIGGRSIAGNPQGFQYSIGQEMSRDVGQQVSQETRGIVDRTLRLPPIITVPANTAVSVSLLENVQFSRRPVVVP